VQDFDFDTKIWRLQPVRQGTLYGAEFRENSRAKRRRAAENKLLKIVKQHRPLWLNATNQTILVEDVEALLNLLPPVAISADDYTFMHNFVCQSLGRGNDLKCWSAEIPPPEERGRVILPTTKTDPEA
jgi:hypothetical protein